MSQELNLNTIKLKITSPETLNEASKYLILAKKELKALTTDMKTLIDPLKESISNIKAKYEPRQTALESFINDVTKQTVTYQTNLVNSQREAELAISERIKPGKGNLSLDTAVKKIEEIPKAETKITTETGAMSFVEYPMCELSDISLLPIEYHIPDMVKIRAEMKQGNKLSGVRYWTEQRPRNSR